ncbi:MAG: GatB/YqeY domain-containing protein [Pseudomonadota bacterium]
MTLKSRIADDMKSAMRDKQTVRLETIRLLRAAIQRKEVDDRTELDDEGVLAVVQKMVKQCQDAASQFEKGGREDLASKELANIEVLKDYLPEQLDEDALSAIIEDALKSTGAESMKDMGKVVAAVKSAVQGRADMAAVSARIRQALS